MRNKPDNPRLLGNQDLIIGGLLLIAGALVALKQQHVSKPITKEETPADIKDLDMKLKVEKEALQEQLEERLQELEKMKVK